MDTRATCYTVSDIFSRICSAIVQNPLFELHQSLCHPGQQNHPPLWIPKLKLEIFHIPLKTFFQFLECPPTFITIKEPHLFLRNLELTYILEEVVVPTTLEDNGPNGIIWKAILLI